jgi:PEP-CTERM motif
MAWNCLNRKTKRLPVLLTYIGDTLKRYFLPIFTAVVFFCCAGTAHAQVTLQLVSPGTNVVAGVYVGPYTMQINGAGTIQIVCDDYSTETHSGPPPWTANVYTFANLSHTEFFNSTTPSTAAQSTLNYEAAAWLTQQIFAVKPTDPDYQDKIADMHYAIWAIFSGAAKTSTGFDLDASNWYTQALGNNYGSGGYNFSNIVIYTPQTAGTAQEFMGVTPEPASIALFGTGLLLIGSIIVRRRSKGVPAS